MNESCSVSMKQQYIFYSIFFSWFDDCCYERKDRSVLYLRNVIPIDIRDGAMVLYKEISEIRKWKDNFNNKVTLIPPF